MLKAAILSLLLSTRFMRPDDAAFEKLVGPPKGLLMNNAAHPNAGAMKRDAERFVRLVQICPNGIVACKAGEIILCNPSLQKIVRRTPDDIIGRPIEDLLAADAREGTIRKLRELKAAGLHHQATIETQMLRSDGGEVVADVSIDELELSGSADEVIVFRPHAVFRSADYALSEELVQLAHMHRMAVFGELTASLLHELGQPLTAASGASEFLLPSLANQQVSEEIERSATIIAESTSLAAKRFQRIWEFVRQKKPRLTEVDVSEVLSRVIDFTETAIRHAGITFASEVREVGSVKADASLLETAIAGLLVRSMTGLSSKSTGPKRITASVSRPESTRIELNIEHNGDVLSSEQQLLQRVPEDSIGVPSKLKLGVIRSILELNNGVLAVEKSAKGDGICYRVIFPL